MLLIKEFRFEASHQLPNHPGKCARLHGHSWIWSVAVVGDVKKETGMVMDYGDIKAVCQPLVDKLDHHHLGYGFVYCIDGARHQVPSDIDGFNVQNPTSENVLLWLADQLPEDFPWESMALKETCTCEAVLYWSEWELARGSRRKEATHGNQEGKERVQEGNEEGKEGR